MDQPTSREANSEAEIQGKSAEERSGREYARLSLLASRHRDYFAATIVNVTPFVTGVQNSQEITHEKHLVGAEADAESFVRTMAELGDRLGPLLLQLPPSFDVEAMGVLEDFLKRLPEGPRYAVEVRHRSWLGDRREFPEGDTHLKKDRDEDLLWWSDLVNRFVDEDRTVFAYANNHYQNHSPSTLARFLEIRRGER
jgi:uncharacterized protein YecE (DUF72 family)